MCVFYIHQNTVLHNNYWECPQSYEEARFNTASKAGYDSINIYRK
jgi:hypothetical protein